MAQLSLVERDNGPGFVPESFLMSLDYEASLMGFIRTVTLIIGNPDGDLPTIASGAHTASTSTTILTDSVATFRSAGVLTGDQVVNTTDSDAVWEIVSVDSQTALTVQLLTTGGADDDFDTDDAYIIRRRNSEDVYIPFSTEIRVTGREVNKVFFRGQVQEAVPQDEQGRFLRVIAVSRESELRDGSPQVDIPSADVRSGIIQDIIDQKAPTINTFLFPEISSFDGEPGLDHSPNQKTAQPDFTKTSRSALPIMLDLAKSEQWCPDVIREPANPVVPKIVDVDDEELTLEAQGSLAQTFQPVTNMMLAKVRLELRRLGALTGSIYIRIESNDEDAGVTAIDLPSGELLTPSAESVLINAAGITTDASGGLVSFVFNEPIAMRSGKQYWIVLSYQEDNNNFLAATRSINWRKATTDAYANGHQAVYSSGAWAADIGEDFSFEIWEHNDYVALYDKGANTWSDLTTEASAADASRLLWMGPGTDDRMYIRTAGPIRGLDLFIDGAATPASAEYGAFTVRYFSDDGAKITGEHTAAGSSGTVLTDSDKDFRKSGVAVGDVIFNRVDSSRGVITAITQTTLTVQDLLDGSENDFGIGDTYAVLNLEQRATGTHDGGAATTVMTDSGADFQAGGIREGDLLLNVTDNLVSEIVAYTATTITTTSNLSWANTNVYRVISRWRTLTLLDTESSFQVANRTPRIEWEMPSNAVSTFLEAGKPEASSPSGVANTLDFRGYWWTVECASIPATRASIDQITPLPGAGFVLAVTDQTHEDVVLAAGGSHDTGANAAALVDTSEDFIGTHDIRIGDIVENLTDGSRGTVTAIQTTTNINDTVVATLAGGTDNDWDVSDLYRFLRARFRVRYFRIGARPVGLPANFGITFRQGSPRSKQMWPITTPQASRSTWVSANRVRVVGRTSGGTVVDRVRNNLRAQRALGRVIVKHIIDYSITTDQEADDRGDAELARLVDTAEYGLVKVFSLPFSTKTAERLNFSASGTALLNKLDGSGAVVTVYEHDTGASAAALVDTTQNFAKWGVEVGDLLTNITDGSTADITGLATGTNENDTLNGTLSGGTEDDWDVGDEYKVERRNYVQVGDLVRVKVDDPAYIDSDYVVIQIKYSEPSFVCELRLAKNLNTSVVDDHATLEEVFQKMADDGRRGLQRASY